ncbi:MAG: PD-(D/E)XK nuclease family protein [Bryobacteraceae bacterium]
MLQRIIQAVEQGATVVAASQRLARVLTASYTSQQRLQGRSVWKSPGILPWGGLLTRLWLEALLSSSGNLPLLLNPTQEMAVWEDIVRNSPEGRDLLQIPQTAGKAMEAWELIHAYRLPTRSGQFTASEDCAAFFTWAKEFERRRDANLWLEAARLPNLIAELLVQKKLAVTQPVYLAGFDEFTPQQRAFFEAIGETRQLPCESFEAAPVCMAMEGTFEELQQAAAWARERLERNPEAQIGVVVPNLARLRSTVERIFSSVFHPSLGAGPDRKSFHMSMGAPLSDAPMIRAAMLIVELGVGDVPLSRMGMLLRGPFLGGAEGERSQRALLDARLRKRGPFRPSLKTVRDLSEACPVLVALLRAIENVLETTPQVQMPGDWSRAFSLLLKSAGWPGDRTLTSHEYQTVRAWNDLLSRFATLDSVTGRMSIGAAFEKLKQIAQSTLFQAEDEGAPVQVMGLFESSGLRFDHLWVTGLHDEALPGPARPNPFLPLELQRANGLPHSSPARELEFAKSLMRRLAESAPELVFSYPIQEGDQRLGPSPFLSVASRVASLFTRIATWVDAMKSTAVLEELADSAAPPVAAGTTHQGGTWLLRDMAACHFRAWAQNRAGARPLEEPEAGLSSRDSGTAVHKALELIWKELQTQRALCSLTAEQTAELVSHSVRKALSEMTGLGRAVEQRRLEKQLADWLEIEKRRLPFTVIETEGKHEINVGALRLKTRVDRLDQLENGRHIILDYKTGEVKSDCWSGDRPDEPQLLVYAANQGMSIGGAAFAQIRAGKIGFHGITADVHVLPGMRSFAAKGIAFDDQVGEWQRILDRLAANFCAGSAEVNPKRHACDYCGFTALCRVQDVRSD